MRRKLLLAATLLSVSSVQVGASRLGEQEQAVFGTEEIPGEPRVKRPLPVPDTVVQILRADDGVKSCLEYNPLAPGQDLSSWFIASEIHLDGPSEADLVVVPSFQGEQAPCFSTPAGIGQFWIFLQTGGGYKLALKAFGNGLSVLKTKINGHRIVQSETLGQAGRFLTTVSFRFDHGRYREYRNVTREK